MLSQKALTTDYLQHTIADSFSCSGIGLHTGKQTSIRVQPAKENFGYRFIRSDVSLEHREIVAHWTSVTDTHLSVTISNQFGVIARTAEHLLAALYGCGIDNATIVIDGPEVPIMDGSAKVFVEKINQAGTLRQNSHRKAIVITKPVSVYEGIKKATLSPYPIPWLGLEINFSSPAIGKQSKTMPLDKNLFEKEIAEARTFGFVDQVETLNPLGYAKGGSLENAVLVDKSGVVNKDGLRFSDEFVRHKVLDAIGDLALAGARVIGSFDMRFSGHKLNQQLLQELFSRPNSYAYTNVYQAREDWLDSIPKAFSN